MDEKKYEISEKLLREILLSLVDDGHYTLNSRIRKETGYKLGKEWNFWEELSKDFEDSK